jgi:hypothetical protein
LHIQNIFFKSVPCTYCIEIEEEFGTTLTTPTVHEAHHWLRTPPKHLYDLTEDYKPDTKAMSTTKQTCYQTTTVDAYDHGGCIEADPPEDLHRALKITTATPSTK